MKEEDSSEQPLKEQLRVDEDEDEEEETVTKTLFDT